MVLEGEEKSSFARAAAESWSSTVNAASAGRGSLGGARRRRRRLSAPGADDVL